MGEGAFDNFHSCICELRLWRKEGAGMDGYFYVLDTLCWCGRSMAQEETMLSLKYLKLC